MAYESAESTADLVASEVAAGVVALPLGRGPGVEAAAGATYNSRGWPEESALSTEGYLQWGWASSVQPWDLERLEVRYDRSASGPMELEIQMAVDGGPFLTVFSDTSVDVAGESQLAIDLGGADEVSAATFRLFAFGAGSNTGTLDIENFQNDPNRGIAVHGQVAVAAVPELNGWMLLLTGLSSMLAGRLPRWPAARV